MIDKVNPMYHEYVKVYIKCFYSLIVAMILSCSNLNSIAGSASQTGNGVVIGMVAADNDEVRNGIVVTLRDCNYNPISKIQPNNMLIRSTVTDQNGIYKFETIPSDTYTIQFLSPGTGKRLIHFDVIVNKNDTTEFLADTLQELGKLRVYLPDTLATPGAYVYIPGTDYGSSIDASFINKGYVEIDSMPAGELPGIYYVEGLSTQPRLVQKSITVIAGETVLVTLFDWKYSRKLILNTTSSGADVSGTVIDFPMLIRLNESNFNFSTASLHGEDIRFTKESGASLPYEIEQWDAVLQKAAIWVKVDTVFGNDNSHSIVMYWGNPAAKDGSNSTEVFDTTNGFQGVWHLCEEEAANAKDATGNHYDGTPSESAPDAAYGVIGTCKAFDGLSNYLHMNSTDDSKLNFNENDTYTVSAWAYIDTLDNASHLIVGKGDLQYFMKFKTSVADSPMVWEFVQYHDFSGWHITNSLPNIPLSKTWVFLVGVRRGLTQYFYINGELVDSTISISPSTMSRKTDSDVTIGRFHSTDSESLEGICPFEGKIDEVRISNTGYDKEWIKLCYMNQKEQNELFEWEGSGGGSSK